MREERFIDSAIRKALARRTQGAASPCPDENLLAAYLERSVSGQERLRLENHILDCASCRELLALSMKVAEDEPVPAVVIDSSQGRKLLFHFSVPLAAVAALVLGIGITTLFLLTREARKPERTEVAEQRLPASGPASNAVPQARRDSRSAPAESMEPFAPSPPPAQVARKRTLDEQEIHAKDKKVRILAMRVPPGQVQSTEPEEKAPIVDRVLSNEMMNMPAEWKGESQEGTATAQAGGEAGAGKVAGGPVGGVVGGVLPPVRPAEEPAAMEAALQATTAATGSGGARTEALEQVARIAAKSQRAALSTASAPAAESRPRDTVRRLAADEKAGRRPYSVTRVIGSRTFERYEGFWVDLRCIENPDAELNELTPGSPQLDEVRKAVPGLDELRRTGLPILLDWNGKIYVVPRTP